MRTPFGHELKLSDLLVVGYQGTLQALAPSSPRADRHIVPHLLTPWLDQASDQLVRRTHPDLLMFGGERIPIEGLKAILEQRMLGLLTHAIDSDDPTHRPVLQNLLRCAVADWTASTAIFLQRLSRDQVSLAAALGVDRLPAIQSITGCASDAHAGGHSVLRVEFAAGAAVFYKPRPVTGEWLWRGLLDSIAELDPDLNLPAMRVLSPRGRFHYGWVDSLEPESGKNTGSHRATSAADYWHRAGAVICLAQHARLSDLHMANILATDRGPAVTDAECLGTPRRANATCRPADESGFAAALDALTATGLLPGKAVAARPDVSGLFGRPGPVAGLVLPHWSVSSTGHWQLEPCAAELIDQRNSPEDTTARAVLSHLVEGYRHAAEALLHARKGLLANGSRWRSVLESEHAPRVVLRETLTYALWVSRSLAPEYLGSAARRRAALRTTILAESAGLRTPPALLRTESNALLQGQIPRLAVEPGRRALTSGVGRVVVPDFSAEPAAPGVMREFERLSHERLNGVLVPALLAACLAG